MTMRDITGEKALVERDKEMIPTRLLLAMLALVLLVLSLVTVASITDRPLEALPPDRSIAAEREIRIYAEMTGNVLVTTAGGETIADLGPEQGGFIAGVGRVLTRERAKVGALGSEPVRLILFENGTMALHDDLTGWRAELQGFGRDNHAAFARLFQPSS